MFPPRILRLAEQVLEAAGAQGHRLATAESVTGGLVAGALTSVPGASAVVEGGIVTYTTGAKQNLLAVPPDLVEAHGAVSPEVTRALLEGVLEVTAATAAVAVTGYASSGQGVPESASGSLFLAAGIEGGPVDEDAIVHPGTREEVRLAAVQGALGVLLRVLQGPVGGPG